MKDTSPSAATPIDGIYRIATVSNLTGIPVQTIRVGESRYAVVQPMRSATNVRLYRRADIERLSLLKAAIDAGHAIGTVASLTDRQIKARFELVPTGVAKTLERACRVLVCGEALAARLAAAWQGRTDVRVQAIMAAPSDVGPGLPGEVDAVIVDAPVLEATLPGALRQLQAATQARVVIVLYGFGNRQTLARLDDVNVIALVAPTDPAQLARICLLGLAVDPKAPDHFSHMLNHPAAPRRHVPRPDRPDAIQRAMRVPESRGGPAHATECLRALQPGMRERERHRCTGPRDAVPCQWPQPGDPGRGTAPSPGA